MAIFFLCSLPITIYKGFSKEIYQPIRPIRYTEKKITTYDHFKFACNEIIIKHKHFYQQIEEITINVCW